MARSLHSILFFLALITGRFSYALPLPFYLSTTDTLELENKYVIIHRDTTAFSRAHMQNISSRVIVALDKIKIKSSRGLLRLKRGNIAVFGENEYYDLLKGQYFEIAFKNDRPAITGPEQWIEPQKNTVIYDDAVFRVFEERLPPHADRALHSHAQRVVVRLNEVQLTDPRFYPDGQPGTGIQVPNTVRFAEPVLHAVRNLSDRPLFNIVLEFKPQPK